MFATSSVWSGKTRTAPHLLSLRGLLLLVTPGLNHFQAPPRSFVFVLLSILSAAIEQCVCSSPRCFIAFVLRAQLSEIPNHWPVQLVECVELLYAMRQNRTVVLQLDCIHYNRVMKYFGKQASEPIKILPFQGQPIELFHPFKSLTAAVLSFATSWTASPAEVWRKLSCTSRGRCKGLGILVWGCMCLRIHCQYIQTITSVIQAMLL